MDRNNILIGALAGAAVGAIVGSCLKSEVGREFLDTASQRVKDLSNKVTDYAKQNLSGLNRESQRTAQDY